MVRHQSEDGRKPSGKELRMKNRRQRQHNKLRERYHEEPDEVVDTQKTTVEKKEIVKKEWTGIYPISSRHLNTVRGISYKDISKTN